MPIKNIVMVHGIGNQDPAFADTWKEEILNRFPALKEACEFKGLYWEDVRQEAAKKYPIIQENFASVLAAFDLVNLRSVLDNASYRMVETYIMDVLVYVGLPDMALYFQKAGLEKLEKLSKGREGETLIIAHSLGAALIPHVLWYLFQFTATMSYHSLILLASPLGFASPVMPIVPSLLDVMGKVSDSPSRLKTLEKFAKAWSFKGPGRLHFLLNEHDVVCSDVEFPFGERLIDIIPVRQSFNSREIKALMDNHPGCHRPLSFGKPEITSIGSNHEVIQYLRTPQFREVMEGLLKA